MKRISYLDGLRGIACLVVVICHYTLAFSIPHPSRIGIFANGECAVALFFLMSGLVLTISFARHPEQILLPAARRLMRLCVPALTAADS